MRECCQEPSESSAEAEHLTLTLAQRGVLAGLWAYKVALSPMLFSQCKFLPSCSAYAAEAVRRHGVARGGLLAAKRILRCRPFAPGGIDPVPQSTGPDHA